MRDVSTGEEKVYDLTMADEPTEAGDPPTKATLLKDTTSALYGGDSTMLPDDVFVKISEMLGTVNDSLDSQPKIAYAKTTGKSITLPFEPGYVVASVGATDDYNWTDAKIVAQGESVAYKTGMSAYIRLNKKVVTSGGGESIANLKAVAFLVP